MPTKLDRILWRYEAGRYHEAHLDKEFDNAIARLVTELGEYEGEIPVLRRRAPTLIPAFDDAINNARRALEGINYKESLQQLKQAQTSLKKMQEVLQTISEYESAKEAYNGLQGLIQSERLNRLTTLRIIAQLVSESNKLLEEGKYRQARFIARMSQRDIKALQRQNREDSEKANHLLVRIEKIAELCTRTRDWVHDSRFDLPDGRTFEALRYLLEDHRLMLVERLIDDLELELAPIRAFLTEYARYQNTFGAPTKPPSVSVEELKQIISGESWDAATKHLLQNGLRTLSSKLQTIHPKILKFVEEVTGENSTDDSDES